MRQLTRPILILLFGIAAFCVVALYEPSIVWYFVQNPWPEFRDIMSQSIYEGGAPGASDIGVTAAIICFLAWLYERKKTVSTKISSLEAKRFVWMSGITSVVVIHSLKWIVSRARPKIFFSQEALPAGGAEPLSGIHWAGFMPFNGPRGILFNSFPSGHTASCALLLTFCYIFAAKRAFLGYLYASLVIIFCALMAIARSMAGMHWLSDSVASFFITWAVVDILFSRSRVDFK